MKLILALAVAALTIVGPSFAQDQSGMAIPRDATTPLAGKDMPYRPGKGSELMSVRYDLRRACAADLVARCPGKDGGAADRCLEYHRLSFTLPCRKAITAFERAASRRPYDTLATYAPISGPIPPPDQRPDPQPGPAHRAPRAASGD